ncbi:MAG: TatD family hydrolase [Eubacterium sp.]|nr:TatD family hydrolase [Eubacterium sp.]
MIFETHAHYDDEQYEEDRDRLLGSMQENGISRIVNAGASIETTEKGIRLAEKYPFVYAAAGVHPSETAQLDEDSFVRLKKLAIHPKTVAVGEIGLDYYWDKEPDVQEKQRYWFRRQLELAAQLGLPVIIHSRDASADTLAIMKEACDMHIPGVIHCFSYSVETALEYVSMGYYIGVGGVVTFKNAKKLKEAVEKIPLANILLETDCPYMAPEPYRGKRNSSLYLPYIAAKIAEIKGMTQQEVIEATWNNACRMYRMDA